MHTCTVPNNILIATFSPWRKGVRLPINGNVEPMLDFFVPRTKKTVLIDQVYPGSDFVLPRIEVYENGKQTSVERSSMFVCWLSPLLWIVNVGGTHILFKLRDFFSVLDWGIRDEIHYDLFIGFEAVNALAGIVLRRFGKVKRVVYYVSDYSPNRYRSKWFNALYLWLDRQAAMYADVIWDVSQAMHPARAQAGLDLRKSAPVMIVPNALYPKQIAILPTNTLEKHSIVFMGTLGIENGPDIAIEAMLYVTKKIPDAILHIVGGGKDEVRLKALSKTLNIHRSIKFHGFISDREKVSKTIRKYQIALAPYKFIPGSARLYGDATKIRAYMASGLPTITTRIPPLGKAIKAAGAGIIVDDSPQKIAEAIVELFRDAKRYARMRRAAIAFAKKNTWDNEFQKAMNSM